LHPELQDVVAARDFFAAVFQRRVRQRGIAVEEHRLDGSASMSPHLPGCVMH
jgi:hypothetical protein